MNGDATAKTTIMNSVGTIALAQDQAQEPLPGTHLGISPT